MEGRGGGKRSRGTEVVKRSYEGGKSWTDIQKGEKRRREEEMKGKEKKGKERRREKRRREKRRGKEIIYESREVVRASACPSISIYLSTYLSVYVYVQ